MIIKVEMTEAEFKLIRDALEMVRDADDDVIKDSAPGMPYLARAKLDDALAVIGSKEIT